MKQRLFYVPDDLYFQPYASMEKMARFYKGYYPKFSDKTFQNLTKVFGLDSSKRINGFPRGCRGRQNLCWVCRPIRMFCCWMNPLMGSIPPSGA